MRIYLDVCCLSRPFDDRGQDRVRLESEAVLTIISHAQTSNWRLLTSAVVDIEISKIPDADKKQKIVMLSTVLQQSIAVDNNIEKRAFELEKMGFKPFDAMHIACAEKGKADILLTTDDNFIRKALHTKDALKITVKNPVICLMEVLKK
ncbi:MAG: PIN domain-containing protein [Deltaproteobacteria bacterium RIFCSPLOWO2_12_FULL_43_16]|nr:MAG: PIN domain-containing protein [Deltaproteobacteria bacterium RIFCSPHIGHO2_02_FULL_43_33]OGQ58873.1 MAG: PIN domain-containing protein [Deltaproteobacteria bacterium RIFCSPLOWO2_12_FULL_43_16]HBR17389.1 PIN domain-containing protein [Deltaproteobacteria bacterium]